MKKLYSGFSLILMYMSVASAADASDSKFDHAKPDTTHTWTEEEMKTATPMPLPIYEPQAQPVEQQREKNADLVQKSSPAVDLQLPYNPDIREQGEAKNLYSPNRDRHPFTQLGILYFDGPSGRSKCSGQFVNQNVVLTAAHCVRDKTTGEWYKNLRFEQSFPSTGKLYYFLPSCSSTSSSYVGSPGGQLDYAFLRVSNSITGWMGLRINASQLPVTVVGYQGLSLKAFNGFMMPNGSMHQITPNFLFGGSSGGAWVDMNTNQVVGSTHGGSANHLSSPVFGMELWNLFQTVSQSNPCK
ncbi:MULTISPECIES: trypsin-like serine peptidase [unclassified Pseudomonas]|uniref:trypsin-like serine peptidase n=1 Tax=unclassified Pseudomonas TaxID=196821 RepID=UPI001B3360EC|nr:MULTISPECIES: serine protease [unclassified Pseudomonas]MBP5946065.1 trypsin-like peptidase domain-containing protein [Pseudomonas sp. P9(2020)]MBZ9564204.1 trypsin-like peptidase domain-containing protein [Pseudomonas sp. P116]